MDHITPFEFRCLTGYHAGDKSSFHEYSYLFDILSDVKEEDIPPDENAYMYWYDSGPKAMFSLQEFRKQGKNAILLTYSYLFYEAGNAPDIIKDLNKYCILVEDDNIEA